MNLCKGCGKEIIWAKNFETGKTLPLERLPKHIYEAMDNPDGQDPIDLVHRVLGQLFLSHFVSCPKAGDFSKKKGNMGGGT